MRRPEERVGGRKREQGGLPGDLCAERVQTWLLPSPLTWKLPADLRWGWHHAPELGPRAWAKVAAWEQGQPGSRLGLGVRPPPELRQGKGTRQQPEAELPRPQTVPI